MTYELNKLQIFPPVAYLLTPVFNIFFFLRIIFFFMVFQLAKEDTPYPKIIKYILLFSSSTFKNFFLHI